MIRLVAFIGSIFCFVIVLGEALGLGLLWVRGQLTPDVIQEIRVIVAGGNRNSDEMEEERENEGPSSEEIIAARSMRILNLESRESELQQLKSLVDDARSLVLKEHDAFRTEKKTFQQDLAQIKSELASEATELAREVLAQSEAKEAVQHLMALDLDRNLVLVKGLSERKIAELLKELSRGDAEQIDRGLKIFEALSRGEPTNALVDKTLNQLGQTPGTVSPGT